MVLTNAGGETDISGVPVTIDLGGSSAWGYDHPPNKNEMSRRLALQTVHAAYAIQGRIPSHSSSPDSTNQGPGAVDSLWTGPVLDTVTLTSANTITVRFIDWSADGLALQDVKVLCLGFGVWGLADFCNQEDIGSYRGYWIVRMILDRTDDIGSYGGYWIVQRILDRTEDIGSYRG